MTSIGHHTAVQLLQQHCPSGYVLDVGAFPGTLTRMLVASGYRVLALDKDPDRGLTIQHSFQIGREIDHREETFASAMRAIGVDTRAADIELASLPVESHSADAVVFTEVIEHLFTNPLLALTEINRVLKPGGVLLLSTPNLTSLRNRINFLRGNMADVIQTPFTAFLQKLQIGHCGHVRTYSPAELSDMLARVGFESAFHFRSFEFWEQVDQPTNQAPAKRRSVLRKFIRSPASYARAAIATSQVMIERACPHLRAHMFVVARKYRDITMPDLESVKVAVQS